MNQRKEMQGLISFLKSISPKELPKILGRWRIDYCQKKINSTVDLANEDHCGTCGQYAQSKIKLVNKLDNKTILEKKI